MTDNQATQMINSLDKIEKHLQAIDWKFWDLYQKFDKDRLINLDSEQLADKIAENENLESLADIINRVEATPSTPPVVKHTLKYPSIEILKNE